MACERDEMGISLSVRKFQTAQPSEVTDWRSEIEGSQLQGSRSLHEERLCAA